MQHLYYMTGFMGSGKTTIGEALAEELKFKVIDLDQWIEENEQQVIKTIFAEKGESYFRELETKALEEVNGRNLIITTGGGIVTKKYNRQLMQEKGTIIYLKCEIDEIIKRLEGDESRPNFRGDRSQVEQLFLKRKALYEEADITVDTTGKSISEIIHEIKELLKF